MTNPHRRLARRELQRLDLVELSDAFSRGMIAVSRLGAVIQCSALDLCEQVAIAFPDDDVRPG